MRIFIEKVLTEDGKSNGELWIESSSLCFTVVHYSDKNVKIAGVEQNKKAVISNVDCMNIIGCANVILTRKIKDSTANDLRELIEDVTRIKEWLSEKLDFAFKMNSDELKADRKGE